MCKAAATQVYNKAKDEAKKVANIPGQVFDEVHENVDRGINKVGEQANFFTRVGEIGYDITLPGAQRLKDAKLKLGQDQAEAQLLKRRLSSGAIDETDALTKKKRLDAVRSGLAATVATSPLGVSGNLTPGTETTLGKR
jgi:hypothetical protein